GRWMSAEQPVTPRRPQSHARGRRQATRPRSLVSRIGRVVAALVSVFCLVGTGVGWSLYNNLSSDLSSAGGLDTGENVLDGAGDLGPIRAGEEDGENTDTIPLIRGPEDGSSATAISIPRDVYVESRAGGPGKINGVYSAAKDAYLEDAVVDSPDEAPTPQDERAAVQAGRNELISAVAHFTGVEVDHYAEIGLLGFVLLTDAVGGVEVCLNEPVDEPLSGAKFDAGVQTISGSDALSFVRQRHDLPAQDLDRIVRQQAFMSQLVKKTLSAGTLSDPGKLGNLVDAAKRSFTIDENWDFVDFAMKLQDISGGNVRFETIPLTSIDSVTEWGESIVTADPDEVAEFVSGFASAEDEGAGPDGATETAGPDGSGPDPSSISVEVVNTTTIDGLASQVSGSLDELGYGTGGLLTDPNAAYTSFVSSASADDDAAFAVSDAL